MGGFAWDGRAGMNAPCIELEQGGTRAALRNESEGNYHTAQGSVVMTTGRHAWNVKMGSERCSNTLLAIFQKHR